MRESNALHRAGRFKDALAMLSAYEGEFAGDPNFDYQFGISALEAGQPGVAQQALERAVLVRPDFAGAWVDLALAHARLGEAETALQIVVHIESSFNVPLPLREQLSSLRNELSETRERPGANPQALLGVRSGYLQVSAGHDTNANLGLAASLLSLTPVGAPPVQVEIAPAARARADAFLQVRGSLQQTLQYSELQKGRLYASGQYKEFSTQKDYSLGDVALSYTHEFALPNWRDWSLEALAGARGITIGGDQLATIATAGTGIAYYGQGCRYGARIANEIRNYGLAGYVDADVPTYTFSATCRRGESQFGLIANIARDDPRGTRAGGRTERFELGMHYATQITPSTALMATGIVGRYQDATGYSPLLENDAVRRITRASLRLELLWQFLPAHPEWAIHTELERLDDRSNLDIFNFSNTRAAVGLRYQY